MFEAHRNQSFRSKSRHTSALDREIDVGFSPRLWRLAINGPTMLVQVTGFDHFLLFLSLWSQAPLPRVRVCCGV